MLQFACHRCWRLESNDFGWMMEDCTYRLPLDSPGPRKLASWSITDVSTLMSANGQLDTMLPRRMARSCCSWQDVARLTAKHKSPTRNSLSAEPITSSWRAASDQRTLALVLHMGDYLADLRGV